LLEFGERVSDLRVSEEELFGFLKYSGYDLRWAEKMLRKSEKWKRSNNVESYVSWKPPKPILTDFKFACIGQDYDNHSVIYLPIGGWHTKKLMDLGYKEEVFEFRFHILEKIIQSIRNTPRSKFVMIMDMEGLTYKKCLHYETIQFLTTAFKDFEDNYPERLRACYVINAPWAFTYIYNVMKHIFSSKTLSKAKIFDADETTWLPQLEKQLPPKVLQKMQSCRLQCYPGLLS